MTGVEICDVIDCHLSEEPAGFLSGLFWSSPYLVVRYISKGKNYKWTAETVQVTGSKEECEALQDKINENLGQGELKNTILHEKFNGIKTFLLRKEIKM